MAAPLDWRTVARTWERHWQWSKDEQGAGPRKLALATCPHCRASYLPLADGYRYIGCGHYSREIHNTQHGQAEAVPALEEKAE